MKKEWLELIENHLNKQSNSIIYNLNDKETFKILIMSIRKK